MLKILFEREIVPEYKTLYVNRKSVCTFLNREMDYYLHDAEEEYNKNKIKIKDDTTSYQVDIPVDINLQYPDKFKHYIYKILEEIVLFMKINYNNYYNNLYKIHLTIRDRELEKKYSLTSNYKKGLKKTIIGYV